MVDQDAQAVAGKAHLLMRPRDSAATRVDAIDMAIKKASQGCPDCAAGYFDLARRHGATQDEIKRVISRRKVSGISRRELLKIAAGGVAAAATVGLVPLEAYASSSWWGTDSNTGSCCGMPQNFYVGEMGAGTTPNGAFNTTAANNATWAYTHEYWFLYGPTWAPPGTDPYTWGVQQGNAATNAWCNGTNEHYVGGSTIFGDVETSGGNGWGTQSNNRLVLQGFLYAVYSYVSPCLPSRTFTAGLYVSINDWNTVFGQSYSTPYGAVLWVADCRACGISCAPCSSCTTTQSQVNSRLTSVSQIILGGNQMVLWQYWLGPVLGCNPNCGDWDVAVQSGNLLFTVIGSSTTYSCSGCGVSGCS